MTKQVKIGNVVIGGENPVAIQSMANIKTSKIDDVVRQIAELDVLGCDIIRVSVKDDDDVKALSEIKKRISIPLVADIHFNYKYALKAIDSGVDKIRINPGNIGSEKNVEEVAKALIHSDVAVRVGSNSGSIEKEFLAKYGKSEVSLAESALKNVAALERYGVDKIVVSAKASNVPLTVKTYEYIHEKTDYPLHVGVTEAGTYNSGIVKSSIGIGSLLLKGIGDTIRVSLTAPPREEVVAAKRILRSVGLDENYVEVISCPTCGRTEYDSISLAGKVEELTSGIKKHLKIAVMGCVVNGPGEAADCDLGIAGGSGYCAFFKNGEVYKKVPFANAEEEFIKEIEKLV
ncbi:MAG: flavodoxin-dependent (E)-4-hydroxy-3-methylbut-2-enyl-diphosphate synthase [Clostridiales bacterium]|nr:flavodoxin-dependent (E)-4-hydroxy-3-methylbut-2-enyl-diphosphate synthase [Clostridiales bacterium]MDY2900971.1 flavodoxin-dependent (E)-4-hydroxy-3-methylbut-2-enyl-diphosphate synthase [Christensenellaceae bacterium]